MPLTQINFAGNPTRRPYLATTTVTKDRRLNACFVEVSDTAVSQNRAVFVSKRAGLFSFVTVDAGQDWSRLFYSLGTTDIYIALGSTNSTVYEVTQAASSTTLGTITGLVNSFSEVLVGTVTYIMMTSTDQTGWFWASDATDTTFTGNTNGNTTFNNIAGLTGTLYPGMAISGTDIPAGTRIASVDSATSITLTAAATGSTVGVTATVSLIAKIINANFPANITGQFAALGGYVFIMTTTGRIYNSVLSVPYSWTATGYIPANSFADAGRGVMKYGNMIAGFGTNSIEFFENAGYSSGSPLSKVQSEVTSIGAGSNNTFIPYAVGHGTVFWVGEDNNLYKFDGLSAVKLTESPFTSNTRPSVITSFSHNRKRFIGIGFSSDTSQWYDVDEQMFVYPSFPTSGEVVGPDANGSCYAASGLTGKLFRIDVNPAVATFQDNGSAYTMTVRTERHYLNGGRPFTITSITELADVQASGETTLKTCGDDYVTYNTIGTFDETQARKVLFGCGYYDSHAIFQVEHSANTPWRGQGLMVQWEPCGA